MHCQKFTSGSKRSDPNTLMFFAAHESSTDAPPMNGAHIEWVLSGIRAKMVCTALDFPPGYRSGDLIDLGCNSAT